MVGKMHPSEHYSKPEDRSGDRFSYGSTGRLLGEEIEKARQRGSHPSDVISQLGNFGVDVITLAELQAELLRVDSRDAVRQLTWPLVLAVIGCGFIVGCFPLAVFGVSWWLAGATSLSLAGASLIVAGSGLVIAGIVFYAAWRSLTRAWKYFSRSHEELKQNLNWLKRALVQRR